MGRSTSKKIDRRDAPTQTNYPEWQSAWAVVELFWVAKSMASAYCGNKPVVCCNKPWFRSRGQNDLRWGVRSWAMGSGVYGG